MSNFALEELDEVKDGVLQFRKLKVDGKCLYDQFCKEVEKNPVEEKKLNKIRTYMNTLAESNLRLSKSMFNSIKDKGVVIGYEFKYDNMRVYVIKKDPNVYVVLGGYKKKQDKDIKSFSKIIKDFTTF